jgi:hypothetical protein
LQRLVAKAHVVEQPTEAFDDDGGGRIGVVAGDKDAVDAHRASEDKRLAQHLGCVAKATVRGPDAVTDVAAVLAKPVVELVADGYAAYNRP